jgi:hypothetical protein
MEHVKYKKTEEIIKEYLDPFYSDRENHSRAEMCEKCGRIYRDGIILCNCNSQIRPMWKLSVLILVIVFFSAISSIAISGCSETEKIQAKEDAGFIDYHVGEKCNPKAPHCPYCSGQYVLKESKNYPGEFEVGYGYFCKLPPNKGLICDTDSECSYGSCQPFFDPEKGIFYRTCTTVGIECVNDAQCNVPLNPGDPHPEWLKKMECINNKCIAGSCGD